MGKFVIDILFDSIVWIDDNELLTNKHRYKIVSVKKNGRNRS